MKIAIPVDDTKTQVCVSFGRTPYFLIHDTESGASELLENPAAESHGGAGLKAAQFVVDQDAEVLITVRCGENAAEVLKAAEIKIYKSLSQSAEDDLKALKDGRLEVLTHFHAGYHSIR